MHKYQAHGCTDVTGFGIVGHATNLAKVQKQEVCFVIHNLPIIAKMAAVTKAFKDDAFGLLKGASAETSGFYHFLNTVNHRQCIPNNNCTANHPDRT